MSHSQLVSRHDSQSSSLWHDDISPFFGAFMAHSASSSQATSIPGIVKPTDVPTSFTFSSSCNRSKSFQLPTMGSSRVHAQNRFSVESISDSFDDDNHAALSRLLRCSRVCLFLILIWFLLRPMLLLFLLLLLLPRLLC